MGNAFMIAGASVSGCVSFTEPCPVAPASSRTIMVKMDCFILIAVDLFYVGKFNDIFAPGSYGLTYITLTQRLNIINRDSVDLKNSKFAS